MAGHGMDCYDSRYEQVVSSHESGDEPSVPLNVAELLD